MHGILEFSTHRQRQIGCAQLCKAQPDKLGVTNRVAILDELVSQKTNTNGKVLANLFPNILENPFDQVQPSFQRIATVHVLAWISARQK